MSTPSAPLEGVNLAVVAGTLSRPPESRTLPSGDELLALEVTVRSSGRPTATIPVAWTAPTAAAVAWEAGQAVVVVGHVRRRFFRAGGVTQSRTEVVADQVISLSDRRRVRAVLRRTGLALEVGEEAG
jgi:single-strand DNA-binding protein